MDYTIADEGKKKKITLTGMFTFADSKKFAEIISFIENEPSQVLIFDLTDLDLMDSAGLGMLLLAHDTAFQYDIRIFLRCNSHGAVRKILDLARVQEVIAFDK